MKMAVRFIADLLSGGGQAGAVTKDGLYRAFRSHFHSSEHLNASAWERLASHRLTSPTRGHSKFEQRCLNVLKADRFHVA